jgi:NCS1 family nucleobase:cation symporter-1
MPLSTMGSLHDRVCLVAKSAKASVKTKLHRDGWVLPKQTTSFAPEGTWTNVDMDVTPLERRIWTPLSFLGYWISDVVSGLMW